MSLTVTGTVFAPLPDAYVSEPYLWAFQIPNGTPTQVWRMDRVPVPLGLSFDAGGNLRGTPLSTGQEHFTVSVQDSGRTASWTHQLSVFQLPAIKTVSLPMAYAGQPYAVTLEATGGRGPLVWSVTAGPLSRGLTLSESGLLSGTPSGSSAFTVTVTDDNWRRASRELSLAITSITFELTTVTLADGRVGEPYTAKLTATGGIPPYSWSFTGTLAAGLTLAADGTISGTPTAQGTAPFTATVRDSQGLTISKSLSLTVLPTSSLFTVGQWNLEWFGAPTQGPAHSTSNGGVLDDLQVAGARDVIGAAGAHVWGLVEMVDTADFETLKAGLPGYSGFLANNTTYVLSGTSQYTSGEQKPGILYESTLTYRSAQIILTAQADDFGGRPPLRVDFTTRIHGEDAPLVVIVVHLKAFDDLTSYGQRQRSAVALKGYLDQWLPEARVLVIGDWNDDLDHSISMENGTALATPYANFLDDPAHYTFPTRVLTDANTRTTTEYDDAIDHTLVTDEVAVDAVPGGVQVLRPDATIPDYAQTVSDHYPVLTSYDFSGSAGPRVKLTAPLGGTFLVGGPLTITWHAVGLDTVRLEASYDDGGQWNVVVPSLRADAGSYMWTVPDVESASVRVRVVDTQQASRFDMNPTALRFTRGQARVIINELLANEPALPGGTAHEFVEVYNAGSAPADLSGWSLWDALASRHVFAAGTVVPPGRGMVVFGGAEAFTPGTPATVAASSGTLSLNNTADSVQLKLADGGIVDSVLYSGTVDAVSINRAPDLAPDAGFELHTTLTPGLPSSPGRRADGGAF
ncbi:putative Ig domain-containing protein [Corallococcus carmarthensis]|uniref:putative Ig domain-containing protein n=1 Tax=Corallococcus carmarthensis TaxID=2316728 RepID=UPI0034CFD59F